MISSEQVPARLSLFGEDKILKKRPKFKRKAPLTVCIAAICHSATTIFAACDRMLTSGDIEFEPEIEGLQKPHDYLPNPQIHNVNAKISILTTSIVALTAGDAGLQAEVINETYLEVSKWLKSDPKRWLSVKEALGMYLNSYNHVKDRCVTEAILTPVGLDRNTFISRQHEMNPGFVLDIKNRLHEYELEFMAIHGVETIITGVDDASGAPMPHIYVVTKSSNGSHVACHDSIGFAAVGSGARHAESQFMLSGHNPHSDREETLLLTYLAKKRSEVAPGVGSGTDMLVIGSNPGTLTMMGSITDFDLKEIDSIYKKMDDAQKMEFQNAKQKTSEYIQKMFSDRAKQVRQTEQTQQKEPSSPPSEPR